MSDKRLKLGLFGFGCVGKGLYEVLEKTEGIRADIVRICVKDQLKPRSLGREYFTFDPSDILNNPEIDVVVELIDDAEAAFHLLKESLKRRKAFVTANKKMLALHFSEILELQKKYDTPVLYEGAVCASIPVIRNLEEYYDNDLLKSFEGIVNGTTNYILSGLLNGNSGYSEILAEAQKNGFAESNPFLDVSGLDACYKTCILLAHAFGHIVSPESFFHYGIENISAEDIRYAKEKGYKIKLISKAIKEEDQIKVLVTPAFINKENHLFNVDEVYNGVLLEAVFSDKQFFCGKGAGAHPTGSAVLSDISALTYNYRYEYKKIRQNSRQSRIVNETHVYGYLRFKDFSRIEEIEFIEVDELHKGKNFGYQTGWISLQSLIEAKSLLKADLFFATLPEPESIIPKQKEEVLEVLAY